ncbi:DUF4861 family protein [Sphingomonas naphthae]|uniref:DUF4861 family protein n=1 Tax=Sphingomonas naphthae TaxID=1813468 RepID=A0ABY7TIR2_9SPHN|nr:DUF4861 family protein [Sphingomonas naphthae]WCT73098.1 DUF4861 family protein [Sphingomonas naphthae]
MRGRIMPLLAAFTASAATCQPVQWYTQDSFKPVERVTILVANPLGEARGNSPVTIRRADLPMLADVHELSMTLVDPAGTPIAPPSARQRALEGAHGRLAETGGHAIDYQLDDLDQDGLWDELFFMADFRPGETRAFHIYLGRQSRGWNPHRTHAGIGSYMRHSVPFWESGNVGWKLWYPTDADVYAKRKPQLMANRLYMENLDGYAVSLIDPGLGSDIMEVSDSFGGGGIAMMDDPAHPDVPSRPRFTPRAPETGNFNAGPVGDTRYAYGLIANGPLRSTVRIRTMNWNSGHGRYALEQTYTAYAGQDYSTATVRFTDFAPADRKAARFAVGIRQRIGETLKVQRGGMVLSTAPEVIRNPDDLEAAQPGMKVAYAGSALVVRDALKPEYLFSPLRGGNHLMLVAPTPDLRFDYLLAAGWSEGAGPRTAVDFAAYVEKVAREYDAPIRFVRATTERR